MFELYSFCVIIKSEQTPGIRGEIFIRQKYKFKIKIPNKVLIMCDKKSKRIEIFTFSD
jgi:hypothetical protein